jgi:hypothetical protein
MVLLLGTFQDFFRQVVQALGVAATVWMLLSIATQVG